MGGSPLAENFNYQYTYLTIAINVSLAQWFVLVARHGAPFGAHINLLCANMLSQDKTHQSPLHACL